MRVLYKHGTRKVGSVQIIAVNAFFFISVGVAQSHCDIKQRAFNAVYLAALVDKANKWTRKEIRGGYLVGGAAVFVLLGDGKIKQPQALKLFAHAVGY